MSIVHGPSPWQPASPFVDTPFPEHLRPELDPNTASRLHDPDKLEDLEKDFKIVPEPDFPNRLKLREKRKSNSRHNRKRFLTAPVTFEEIREVDEEYSCSSELSDTDSDENGNHDSTNRRLCWRFDPIMTSCAIPNQNVRLHKNWRDDTRTLSPKKQLLVGTRSLTTPFFGSNHKLRQSPETVPRQNSLPTIPEAATSACIPDTIEENGTL